VGVDVAAEIRLGSDLEVGAFPPIADAEEHVARASALHPPERHVKSSAGALCELHLRLDRDRRRNSPVEDSLEQVVQMARSCPARALARAGFAAEGDNAAPAGERVGQALVEYLAVGTPLFGVISVATLLDRLVYYRLPLPVGGVACFRRDPPANRARRLRASASDEALLVPSIRFRLECG
jgi:hypothetical protein